MFPPPQPWKAVADIDPAATYAAFSSRFALRSPLRLPAFLNYSLTIQKQVRQAPRAVGYALAADFLQRHFYTLSAWRDEQSLAAFARSAPHSGSMAAFHSDMRSPRIFRRGSVRGADLPLTWKEALARQAAQETA